MDRHDRRAVKRGSLFNSKIFSLHNAAVRFGKPFLIIQYDANSEQPGIATTYLHRYGLYFSLSTMKK